MKTILVTGAAGFIGSAFLQTCRFQFPNDRIIAFDSISHSGVRGNIQDDGEQLIFVEADIRNQSAVNSTIRDYDVSTIVNLAAESHNSFAVVDPMLFFDVNLTGTQILLEAARQFGIERFHQVSTCEVYGEMELQSSAAFNEESPYRPRSPYNASKAAADHLVQSYHHTFEIPTTISLCCNNYGPRQFIEKIIPKFTIRALAGEQLPIYRSSHYLREWIHVDDHCNGIAKILKDGKKGARYNIGSGIEASVEDIADIILRKVCGSSDLKTYIADRPAHDQRYLLDSTKITNELIWTCQTPFKSGMDAAIQWYIDNPEWWQPLLNREVVDERRWDTFNGSRKDA